MASDALDVVAGVEVERRGAAPEGCQVEVVLMGLVEQDGVQVHPDARRADEARKVNGL